MSPIYVYAGAILAEMYLSPATREGRTGDFIEHQKYLSAVEACVLRGRAKSGDDLSAPSSFDLSSLHGTCASAVYRFPDDDSDEEYVEQILRDRQEKEGLNRL